MQVGVLGLDLAVLILAVQDIGIRRARNLDLRRRHMLPLRIPDGDVADHSDVGADELLGTHDPDLGIIGVLGKHHVLAQKLPDAIVSRGQDVKTLV
jgi:hypothetical protein